MNPERRAELREVMSQTQITGIPCYPFASDVLAALDSLESAETRANEAEAEVRDLCNSLRSIDQLHALWAAAENERDAALKRVAELEKAAHAYRDLSTCYRLGKRRVELRKLREAATQGSWVGFPSGVLSGATWVVENTSDESGAIMGSEDAECIAAAVNALVPLLDALDAAEAKSNQYAADWYAAKSEFGVARAKVAQQLREVTAERDALAKRVAELEAAARSVVRPGYVNGEDSIAIPERVIVALHRVLGAGRAVRGKADEALKGGSDES